MVDFNPSQIASNINLSGVGNAIGWIIAAIIFLAAIGIIFWWWYNKKIFNKFVTRFELTGNAFEPSFRDTAKSVKLGKGGFEVLFWKKAKVYRIAFGKRIGKNTYYFFTAPDGYEYNGILGKEITTDGRIPIITGNPSMRAQYTALEKQIDSLHGEQTKFWDKYGTWIMGIGFVMVIGVFAYLFFREWSSVVGQMPELVSKMSDLVDKMNRLLVNSDARNVTTLVQG